MREATTGKELLTLYEPAGLGVRTAQFGPDGTWFVTGSYYDSGVLKVWDVASAQETLSLRGHEAVILSLAVSPDGKKIVSGDGEGLMKVWNAQAGDNLLTVVPPGNVIRAVLGMPDRKPWRLGTMSKQL